MARTIYVKSARARYDKVTGAQKPLRVCESCNKSIEVRSPYKYIDIKTSAYSSHTRYRCGDCSDWMIWEYSNSLSARIAEIDFNARNAIGGVDDKDAAIGVLSETADSIRELADEKQESAQSLEDGFGHSTSQSEELAQQAEDLTAWASEVENAEIPDDPDPEEVDCETCDGTGQIIEEGDCPDCDGQGHPDEATEEQLDTWRDEVTSALETVLDSCPV